MLIVEICLLEGEYHANRTRNRTVRTAVIVPRDYDPTTTAVYFSNKLKASLAGPTLDDRGASAAQTSIYQELKNAFRQGGWGDLQRPLADKTDVVRAFIPAASFNLGVGAAAGGVSASEAVFFGGAYNV
ncbi:hypothetical protein, partial [Bradyrhizobium sp.]|uniref:hypothetical protein n=1 Tax=Bradyrhizobium sp. TaxID=376 RepID=UPI002720DFBA